MTSHEAETARGYIMPNLKLLIFAIMMPVYENDQA